MYPVILFSFFIDNEELPEKGDPSFDSPYIKFKEWFFKPHSEVLIGP